MIDGIFIEPLKVIGHPKGDILHGVKSSDENFFGFGEAYFSSVKKGSIKGWKCHTEMILNLIVPVGEIRFVVYDDRPDSATYNKFVDVTLGEKNYSRLTVDKGLWLAFQGIGDNNMLLNVASIEHQINEAQTFCLDEIPFNW